MTSAHRVRLVTLFAVAALVTMSGLAGAQTTVTLWFGGMPIPASEALEELVDRFNAENPDINVEASRLSGYAASLEQAVVAYAGGAAPNILLVEQMQSFGSIVRGMFAPLNPYIEADPDFNLDDFYPPMLETGSYQGVMYGIPFNTSTPLAYINKDVFAEAGLVPEAPQTWDEFARVARQITRDTDGDGEPNIWGTDQTKSWGWLFDAWISQNGARMTNADGTAYTFNTTEAVAAMEFLQDLRHNHKAIRYPGASKDAFAAGETGMIHRSTADLFGRMEIAELAGTDMGVGFLPCGTECWVPIGGANLFMLNTGTEAERDAAWKLLNFLTSTESLAEFSSKSGYMSARRSSMMTDTLSNMFYDYPAFLVTYEQLEYAHPRPQVPDWGLINSRIAGEITPTMFAENGNVKVVMDDIVRYGNQVLDEFYAGQNAGK